MELEPVRSHDHVVVPNSLDQKFGVYRTSATEQLVQNEPFGFGQRNFPIPIPEQGQLLVQGKISVKKNLAGIYRSNTPFQKPKPNAQLVQLASFYIVVHSQPKSLPDFKNGPVDDGNDFAVFVPFPDLPNRRVGLVQFAVETQHQKSEPRLEEIAWDFFALEAQRDRKAVFFQIFSKSAGEQDLRFA